MPETPEVLFTKSAFKIATHCPTQAYYYRNSMSKKKKDGHYEHEGERDMIDLCKIGKPIYGSEIKSRNYTAEFPLTLIVKNESGEVQNPYKALPQLKEIQDELIGEIAEQGLWSKEELEQYVQSAASRRSIRAWIGKKLLQRRTRLRMPSSTMHSAKACSSTANSTPCRWCSCGNILTMYVRKTGK